MTSLRAMPRWQRLMTFLLFRRRLVFSLLVINLMVFVVMYVVTISGDDQTQEPDTIMVGDIRGDGRVVDQLRIRHEDAMLYPADRFRKDPIAVIDHYQKKCDALRRPAYDIKENYKWHTVSKDTFIFSAYFDNRTSTDSVIIWGTSGGGLGLHLEPSKRYCQAWYADTEKPSILWAEYEIVPETHGLRYAPAMYICRVMRREPPYAVSLVTSKCAEPTHVLPVKAPGDHQRPKYQFTVCVSPLNMHYDDIHSFTENVEINRILGANKIVLYNHTTGGRLDRYLDHYVRDGLIDVIPWNIPVTVHPDPPDPLVSPEIHYFGQVVAQNECLYRYMYESKYIVFTDLDEVLVPRQHSTWNKLMKMVDRSSKHVFDNNSNMEYSKNKYGAFLFRNVFFRIDWPDESKNSIDVKLKLRTQLKLRREMKIWALYERTKFIVLPERVSQVGIHFVFNFLDGSRYQHKEVSSDLALLHHYRDWGDEVSQPDNIVDTYMTKYESALQRSVIRVHDQVGLLDVDIDWDYGLLQ